MKRLATLLALLTASPLVRAHGGHWHLDEETLEKIFAAADAVYGWFAAHAVAIAAATLAGLTAWAVVRWRCQRHGDET